MQSISRSAAFRTALRAYSTGITRVGVVGMGLMGHGVAQQSAASGYEVVAVDISADQLSKGIKAIETSLAQAAAKEVKKVELVPIVISTNSPIQGFQCPFDKLCCALRHLTSWF